MSAPSDPVASLWFASATAGIIASLKTIEVRSKWVAVPPNVCPNVLAAIWAAGAKPWFVDIEADSHGMDPVRLTEIIDQISAVIAIHAYGMPCRIVDLRVICSQSGIPLIEDCAQAEGATIGDSEVGSFGDFAVFSFGAGKIIDAGGGGLVVVNRPDFVVPLTKCMNALPIASESTIGADLSGVYRHFYNSFYPDKTALIKDAFHVLTQTLAPNFSERCDPQRIPKLLDARLCRRETIEARRRKYQNYFEILLGLTDIDPIPLTNQMVPWRFNVLIGGGRRDRVFRSLLQAGIRASTWYPRLTCFLPSDVYRSTALPVAERYEKKLLNLAVDDKVSYSNIVYTCEIIQDSLMLQDGI